MKSSKADSLSVAHARNWVVGILNSLVRHNPNLTPLETRALKELRSNTDITFLSIEIDSKSQELRLPAGNYNKILTSGKKKERLKKELLSIIGSLSFTTKVVPAKRLFLQRNEKSMLLNTTWTSVEDLQLYIDASGTHGYRAFFKGASFHASWLPHQISRSIEWKELFGTLVAATTWAKKLKNLWIKFFGENQAIVHTWQNKHPAISDLCIDWSLRQPQFLSGNVGCNNKIANALSRNKLTVFCTLIPHAEPLPTQIPPDLDDI